MSRGLNWTSTRGDVMEGDRLLDPTGITRRELMKIVAAAGAAAVLPPDSSKAVGASPALTVVVYDDHVVFDNSASVAGHEASYSYLVPPSTLETMDGKFPVDSRHFVSPPNGLRLKWRSATGGDWKMTLKLRRRRARPHDFRGDSLTFWCFSESDITAADSPLIYLQDSAENGTPAVKLVEGDNQIAAGKWVQVKLSFASFSLAIYNSTAERSFN